MSANDREGAVEGLSALLALAKANIDLADKSDEITALRAKLEAAEALQRETVAQGRLTITHFRERAEAAERDRQDAIAVRDQAWADRDAAKEKAEKHAEALHRAAEARVKELERREQAACRYMDGEQCGVSTGIHGGETRGYGALDANGFWEYQIPDVVFQRFGKLKTRVKELEDQVERMLMEAMLGKRREWIEAARADERRKAEGELAEARGHVYALLRHEADARSFINAPELACAYLARTQPASPRAEDAQEEKEDGPIAEARGPVTAMSIPRGTR
jgi:hypothetical protein